MNIKEFYKSIDGDYDGLFSRLNNEALLNKIVKMFLSDNSYNDMKDGLEKKDAELAFRGAHTLKGVTLNLGFTKLANKASEFTEMLRGRVIPDNYKEIFDEITLEYNKTIKLIESID